MNAREENKRMVEREEKISEDGKEESEREVSEVK